MNKQYFAALKQHITTYLLLDRCEEHDGSFQGRLFRIKTRLIRIKQHLELCYDKQIPRYVFFGVLQNFLEGEVQDQNNLKKLKKVIWYLLPDAFFDIFDKEVKYQYASVEEYCSEQLEKLRANYHVRFLQEESDESRDLREEKMNPYTYMKYSYMKDLYRWDDMKFNKLTKCLSEYFLIPEDKMNSFYFTY